MEGIKFIHQNNCYHGDLKIDNIFLDGDFELKIGDFGLSSKMELNQ